jgi:putative copper resistance protein D
MDDATLTALRTAASALSDIGFAAMAGALATLALLHDTSSEWALRGARRCRVLFMRANLLAVLASLAWLELEAIALTELSPRAALLAAGDIVTGTSFGRAWALATAALGACVALAMACRDRSLPVRVLGVMLTVVAAAHASAGHAGADGLGWRVPTIAVHILATGLWAGGVFAAVLVVARGAPDAIDSVRYAGRLSALATAALAGTIATGLAGAWHGLGGSLAPLEPAAGSSWGVLLDAKLALVAIVVALGGFNRFAVMPSLPGAWPRFVRVLRVEAVGLLAVLAAAALLANGEPPAA